MDLYNTPDISENPVESLRSISSFSNNDNFFSNRRGGCFFLIPPKSVTIN